MGGGKRTREKDLHWQGYWSLYSHLWHHSAEGWTRAIQVLRDQPLRPCTVDAGLQQCHDEYFEDPNSKPICISISSEDTSEKPQAILKASGKLDVLELMQESVVQVLWLKSSRVIEFDCHQLSFTISKTLRTAHTFIKTCHLVRGNWGSAVARRSQCQMSFAKSQGQQWSSSTFSSAKKNSLNH